MQSHSEVFVTVSSRGGLVGRIPGKGTPCLLHNGSTIDARATCESVKQRLVSVLFLASSKWSHTYREWRAQQSVGVHCLGKEHFGRGIVTDNAFPCAEVISCTNYKIVPEDDSQSLKIITPV